ncbi:hypothetical protein [Pseudanabaena sp. Chao 1811]|nr:hypothetical protein [Pseudanabaena sp. Chao 1811]
MNGNSLNAIAEPRIALHDITWQQYQTFIELSLSYFLDIKTSISPISKAQ